MNKKHFEMRLWVLRVDWKIGGKEWKRGGNGWSEGRGKEQIRGKDIEKTEHDEEILKRRREYGA